MEKYRNRKVMTFAPLPYDYHPLQCEFWKRFSFPNLTAASAALNGGFPATPGPGLRGRITRVSPTTTEQMLRHERRMDEENAGPGTAWH